MIIKIAIMLGIRIVNKVNHTQASKEKNHQEMTKRSYNFHKQTNYTTPNWQDTSVILAKLSK